MRDPGIIIAEVELALDILDIDLKRKEEVELLGGGTGAPVAGGVTDHTLLTNIGVNTHNQIDAHLALINEHIDHSAVNIIAGVGLSGGGDLTANRILNVDDIETLPTSLAAGSVVFSDGSNLAENNANFFWDDSSKFLKVNEIRLNDSKKITFGDDASTDSFIQFNGTDLSLFSVATHVFSSDITPTLQAPEGTAIAGDGINFIVRAGDGHSDVPTNGDGGDLTIRPGNPDGSGAYGTLYLGNSTGNTEVWNRLTTGLFFGDSGANSAKIYHDGTDLVIDPRNTGTGGTLLFNADASFEGNVNFDQVDEITLAEAQSISLQVTFTVSSFAAGTYHYDFYYITANGQTSSIDTQHGTAEVPDITINATESIFIENIPISSDRRVTGRGIMRTEVDEAGAIAQTIITINDNTTTSFEDVSEAAGTGALNFKKPNTTAGSITIETINYLRMNEFQTYLGKEAGLNSIAPDNVAIGSGAFKAATTATDTTVMGVDAGKDTTTGITNTFVGRSAGVNIGTGNNNVMVGAFTQPIGADCAQLTALGKDALRGGPGTGQNSSTGIGFSAGENFGGANNTFLGAFAGNVPSRIAAADNNIIIGYTSGMAIENGADNNIIIGINLEPDDPAASDQLRIGTIIKGIITSGSEKVWFPLGNVGIGTDSPGAPLHIVSGDTGFTVSGFANELWVEHTGHAGITITSGADKKCSLYFGDSNNDVGQIYYDHATNTMHFWDLNAERLILANAGSQLKSPSLTLGSNFDSGSITDQVRKLGRMFAPHYLNAEEPVNVFLCDSDGTDNIIGFGDGSANGNKATQIRFTTGPNDTTVGSGAVDTSVLKITSSQETLIGAPGVGTNYAQFNSDGSLFFIGTAGLAFGEIYCYDSATTMTISGTGIANKVQVDCFDTDGESNNTTPDHTNDHITILKAGRYKVNISAAILSGGGASYLVGMAVYKNNGATLFQNLHMHRNLAGGGGDTGSIGMTGIIDVEVDDTIEVWAWNETNTTDLILDDITMNIIQIGG